MERVLTLALWGVLAVAGFGYSQEIPDGVKEIMEKLQTDSTVEFGFNYAKRRGYLKNHVQFTSWYVGLPIEFYRLNGDKIERSALNSSVADLIETINVWYIPIRIMDDGYSYHVMVFGENNEFEAVGCGESVLGFMAWDRIRQKYPEESGVRPVVIGMKHKFVYFPDKTGDKNIYYVKNPKWKDDLSRVTSNSLDSLDDSKIIIKYWKKEWERNKEKRRQFFEKHPDVFNGMSGGE